MKKTKATILSLLTLTAAMTLTAAGLCAQKSPLSALAETSQSERLIAPSSYEEYLSLTAPTDVAATDGYVAIADGKTLFVFDKDNNLWQEYVHSNPITKLHFGSRDELYFLDGQTNALYAFNAKTLAAPTETGIVCSTFSIHGDSVYYINVSAGQTTIYRALLSDFSTVTKLYAGRMYSPALSYWNGEIYYLYGTDYLHKLHPETGASSKVAELPAGVLSMTISEGVVCCATEDGGFYAYNLAELSEKGSANECEGLASYQADYSAVSANSNDIYLVAGKSIKKFSLEEKALTDYLIGSASDAPHRLNGASETVLAGNKLFISDDNNDRISVYDVAENAFKKPIPSEMDSPYMASHGETLLVSTSSQALLYSLNDNTYGETVFTLTADKISGNVVGAAAVYGTYYLVTDTNYCYTLTESDEGYVFSETLRKAHFAEKLTADANGCLYVLADGAIYRYTEENFLSQSEAGIKLCADLPVTTSKISVDYGGNLYALADSALYRYSAQENGEYALHSSTQFNRELVYNVTPTVTSFAFSIEDNATYLLYEENYLTVTAELSLPTLKTIPTEGIDKGIFGETQAEFSVVQTLPNSLIVEVDGEKLNGAETFPYLSYRRSESPITALKIGETENYALLSYRENLSSEYKTVLVDIHRQTEIKAGYDAIEATGYLTNRSKAYKFPSMGLPTLGEMEKNAEIAIVGELNGLDCDYYAVAYGEQTAYIPKSHVTLFNGAPPVTETITEGDPDVNKNAIWRLAYLMLGSAAICILIDVLILRKKDKEE